MLIIKRQEKMSEYDPCLWVLSGGCLHTDGQERIVASDAVGSRCVLGAYSSPVRRREVINEIFEAVRSGAQVYEMPLK